MVREHGRLSRVVGPYRELEHAQERIRQAKEMLGDPEMEDLAKEELEEASGDFERLLEEVKGLIIQSDALADRTAIVEVRAGTGGDEASLFAGDLVRMYQMHAQRRGWKIDVIDLTEGDQGGCKEAVLEIRGTGAYGMMRWNPAATACSACRKPRAKVASTPPPPPLRCCPKPRMWKSRSKTTISSSSASAPVVPVVSTSTKPNPPSASPTCPRALSSPAKTKSARVPTLTAR